MANEDVIGLTVNGESVATFYVPNVGHKLKAGEYQIVNVGGILEVSVALVKDINKAFEFKKEIPLEIIPPAETHSIQLLYHMWKIRLFLLLFHQRRHENQENLNRKIR